MSKLPLPRTVARTPQSAVMLRRPAPQRLMGRAGYKGRSVGTLVPKITQKVFEKFGFSTATLLTDWAIIVGRELAVHTAPERLKWPRGQDGSSDTGEAAAGRPGATLMLRVEPARALDVQYKARLLIDRINAYFGHRAVAEIRLIQAPLVRAAEVPVQMPRGVGSTPPDVAILAVTDAALRAALIGLEASIKARALARLGTIPRP